MEDRQRAIRKVLSEACRYASLSRNTVKKMLLAGQFAGECSPGGHWRVDRESIDEWFGNLHLPHLRHTFASLKAMEGATIQEIQALLGHKDIKVTMIYSHLSDDHIRKVAERLISGRWIWGDYYE